MLKFFLSMSFLLITAEAMDFDPLTEKGQTKNILEFTVEQLALQMEELQIRTYETSNLQKVKNRLVDTENLLQTALLSLKPIQYLINDLSQVIGKDNFFEFYKNQLLKNTAKYDEVITKVNLELEQQDFSTFLNILSPSTVSFSNTTEIQPATSSPLTLLSEYPSEEPNFCFATLCKKVTNEQESLNNILKTIKLKIADHKEMFTLATKVLDEKFADLERVVQNARVIVRISSY